MFHQCQKLCSKMSLKIPYLSEVVGKYHLKRLYSTQVATLTSRCKKVLSNILRNNNNLTIIVCKKFSTISVEGNTSHWKILLTVAPTDLQDHVLILTLVLVQKRLSCNFLDYFICSFMQQMQQQFCE